LKATGLTPRQPMRKFQELLADIPNYDDDQIQETYQKCLDESQCEYLEDLIAAVFIAHTKILASIRNDNEAREFRLQVPSGSRFIHRCLIEISRELWKAPYLFREEEQGNRISNIQIQKNIRSVEKLIKECV